MRSGATRRELTAERGDVSLAGTLWLPGERPSAIVLMHPGSGPSDRDNDVYFPPIREHLLSRGIAVSSFDKRGVGGSTGRWEDAAIGEQADDALAAVEAIRADQDGNTPIGLFGHSQGGWVVVEAASRSSAPAFVVTNSGPGVTPARQERFAARTHLERSGASSTEIEVALERFDVVLGLMREGVPLAGVGAGLEAANLADAQDPLGLVEEPALWDLMAAMADHDPRPALERVEVPVLALFGGDDAIVPVEESVTVFEEAVRPDLLSVVVFPNADHRLRVGDPPRLAEGYLETLSSFVAAA
jgi:hypothetical protein